MFQSPKNTAYMRNASKPGSQGRGDFRLVRQTHASFVDSLFLKAHLEHLDREHEALKQQRSSVEVQQRSSRGPAGEPAEFPAEGEVPTNSKYVSHRVPGSVGAGREIWTSGPRSTVAAIKLEEMAASTVTSARGAGTSRGGGRWKGAGVEAARDDNPRFLIDGTSMAPGNGSVRASADLACVGGDEDGVQAWARRSGGGHIYSEENSSRKSSRT